MQGQKRVMMIDGPLPGHPEVLAGRHSSIV
jgi:hypothetical protein